MADVKLRLLRSHDPDPTNLEALMQKVAKGDERAFSSVYDELSPLVYGVVLGVVRAPAIAEEIAQEVFVELWRLAPRFDSRKASARGWAR